MVRLVALLSAPSYPIYLIILLWFSLFHQSTFRTVELFLNLSLSKYKLLPVITTLRCVDPLVLQRLTIPAGCVEKKYMHACVDITLFPLPTSQVLKNMTQQSLITGMKLHSI